MRTAVATPEEEPEGRSGGRRRTRRNGEGSIRLRKDGRYEGRLWVPTTDGGEIRRSVYGATWEEAHEELTKLKAQVLSGARVSATGQTVAEYLDYWLREVARDRVRPSTFASYEWLTRRYVVPYLGRKKLARLTPPEIRKFLNRLKGVCQCCALGNDAQRVASGGEARCCARKPRKCCESFLSDGSIRYVHRLLRAALQDAVTDGLLAQNPAKSLRLAHRYRPKFTTWTGEEATRFLKAAREDRLYALYAVALALGLRRGEALGLRWGDVDFADGVLRVAHSLQRVNGQLRLGPVKTDGSARKVAVPAPLLAVLKEHRARQDEERKAAGARWREHGLVFTTKIGTPVEPRNVNRHFQALCARARVPRIRFHDLRHSCATLLYEQGVSLENIQDVLGHSSPNVTKTIYIETTLKVQREAVDRLGFLFGDES